MVTNQKSQLQILEGRLCLALALMEGLPPSTKTQRDEGCLFCGRKASFRSVGLDCQVSSAFLKAWHREGPGELFHLLPEPGQALTCFWVLEQEGFEILELG